VTAPGRNADVGFPPVSDPSSGPGPALQAADIGSAEPGDLAALVRSWATGWALSRGFPAPDPIGSALWIRPGEPGRERELVWALAEQEIEPDLLATIGASPTPTWVTVATQDVSQTQGQLSERGVVPAGWPEWLMAKQLAEVDQSPCPESFTCTLEESGSVLRASARTGSGVVACSGQMAITGDGTAVADRIVTEEAFRRRGLGRHLMGRLSEAALARGATRGVLIASAEGHGLYTALQWAPLCDIVVARNTAAMA
jgi:GNAT superfamily N-acetyltransferase